MLEKRKEVQIIFWVSFLSIENLSVICQKSSKPENCQILEKNMIFDIQKLISPLFFNEF